MGKGLVSLNGEGGCGIDREVEGDMRVRGSDKREG